MSTRDKQQNEEVPYPLDPNEGDGNQFPQPEDFPPFPDGSPVPDDNPEKPPFHNDDDEMFYLNNNKGR